MLMFYNQHKNQLVCTKCPHVDKGEEGILHSSMFPLGLRAIHFRTFHYGTRCNAHIPEKWMILKVSLK